MSRPNYPYKNEVNFRELQKNDELYKISNLSLLYGYKIALYNILITTYKDIFEYILYYGQFKFVWTIWTIIYWTTYYLCLWNIFGVNINYYFKAIFFMKFLFILHIVERLKWPCIKKIVYKCFKFWDKKVL